MTTIVMTGASSGLGEVTARRLLARKGTRLIVGTRSGAPRRVEKMGLDLARLESVRAFAAELNARLGASKIDALVLNAGLQFTNGDERTVDGFETTFAVNHLAHYLLLRLLMPRLADGAHVVLTSSGTHDPAQKTIIPAPRHANAEWLAHPEEDPDRDKAPMVAGRRAYSASKLCNVLTARALAARPEAQHLTVIAYDPGFTPATGLVRNAPLYQRLALRLPRFVLGLLVGGGTNSRAAAGRALADLTTGAIAPPPGRIYASLRKGKIVWHDPSELARRDDVRDALWRDSAALVGLAP
jgi:NAD(P)-dependent dehydrogenase (short-subunit alcohol dehydrogenase family)